MESRILAVRQETPDTVTLRVHAPFTFVPGQFAIVGVLMDGKEVRRSYSISSASNGEWIEVTVKAQQQGKFSVYAQHMKVGDPINVYGPFGKHFLFDVSEPKEVVFIAGGSGISPFRSMLQSAADYTGTITLLYSVKSTADVIFAQELSSFATKANIVITVTRPSEEELHTWNGKFGRVTGKLLHETLGELLTDKHYYICGPTAMVQDVQTLLSRLGVPKNHVQVEKFGMIDG